MSKDKTEALAALRGLVDALDAEPATEERRRGNGESVALTVRLPRADWMRLHALAIAEGVSLQEIANRGLSRIFADKGLTGHRGALRLVHENKGTGREATQ